MLVNLFQCVCICRIERQKQFEEERVREFEAALQRIAVSDDDVGVCKYDSSGVGKFVRLP